ncbi:carbohydrate esterase family 4 protein [Schizophyllum commune]
MKAFGIAQTILCASTVASALFAPTPTTPHEGHEHVARRRTEKRWYHDDDHPVRRLFVRQDGGNTAEYGTPEWAHAYPTGTPTPDQIPQDWLDALKAAQDAGKIPDFPPTTVQNDNPVYPEGSDPNGPEICSSYYKCRADGTLWDAPEGKFGVGFDDGPYDGTTKLMDFLTEQQQAATHFIIGLYITYYPDEFKRIFDSGDDIAVHTYTHPHMSSLSNEDLVAQFGWTLQIISDATGGRIPRYWRPPYGDSDNRVFAIAKEVFGLEAILWNQDTEDWSLTTGGTTLQTINSSMHDWLTGPKSPGLIVLEHELSLDSVQAFMDAYPVMKENNWDLVSVVDFGSYDHVYQNSDDNTADVTSTSILAPYETGSGSSSDAE